MFYILINSGIKARLLYKWVDSIFENKATFLITDVDFITITITDNETLRPVKWVTLRWFLFGVHPYQPTL